MSVSRLRTPTVLLAASAMLIGLSTGHAADQPNGTRVEGGSSIDLFKAWPEIGKAPKGEMATIELLVRPDEAAIARPRSFIMTLSNAGGNDVAGISLTLKTGVLRAHVLGTALEAREEMSTNRWTHVALTINTQTVNKQAKLWINGKLIAESLVLEYWPQSFEVAQMLSDKWSLARVFSGHVGDVRVSRVVRYDKPFESPTMLARDKHTVVLLHGSALPLE